MAVRIRALAEVVHAVESPAAEGAAMTREQLADLFREFADTLDRAADDDPLLETSIVHKRLAKTVREFAIKLQGGPREDRGGDDAA